MSQSSPMSVDNERENSELAQSSLQESEGKGTNILTCFFCNQSRKKHCGKILPLVTSTNDIIIEKIVINANTLNDIVTLSKITALGANRVIYYHNNCKLNYFKKNISAPIHKQSDWHITREVNDLVYNELYSFIADNTIKNKQCYSLKFLVEYSKNALHRLFSEQYKNFDSYITSHYLLAKL